VHASRERPGLVHSQEWQGVLAVLRELVEWNSL
jgi:hypothetical protein